MLGVAPGRAPAGPGGAPAGAGVGSWALINMADEKRKRLVSKIRTAVPLITIVLLMFGVSVTIGYAVSKADRQPTDNA